ncbi:MAG: hypothetical protein ACRDL1_10635 [Solirubrobacterales bacterium]
MSLSLLVLRLPARRQEAMAWLRGSADQAALARARVKRSGGLGRGARDRGP